MAVIALDGRKYFDFGIGTYIQQLVRSLSLLNTSHNFVLYASPADRTSIVPPSGWTVAEAAYSKYSFSEIAAFGFKARRDHIEVFHEPHYTLPVGLKNISVATIHDIIHLRFPELFSPLQRAYSRAMIWHALKNSRTVIVDSEFTKRDILSTFQTNPDKIKVIPLGVGEQFRQVKNNGKVADFRRKFGLERQYVLYVGNVKPHKGMGTLLEAFHRIHRSNDLDLVLVGGMIHDDVQLPRMVQEFGMTGRIKELGRLSDDDLVMVYNGAEALVMPSRYEGFGLPALEAMACGVPVLVSNAASLPEVAGDAALVFEVGNSKELAEGLARLLKEPSLRRNMIQKGKARAKQFTWKETATRTMDVYEQIICR
jgi:glycosyltransferase involved in cell wall biosynthesis